MLKPLYDLTRQLLSLARDTQQNKADIRELQQQVEELTETVRRHNLELQHWRETEARERENLLLRLENAPCASSDACRRAAEAVRQKNRFEAATSASSASASAGSKPKPSRGCGIIWSSSNVALL
jgi:chromosome segregation ATPase